MEALTSNSIVLHDKLVLGFLYLSLVGSLTRNYILVKIQRKWNKLKNGASIPVIEILLPDSLLTQLKEHCVRSYASLLNLKGTFYRLLLHDRSKGGGPVEGGMRGDDFR